MLSAVLSALHLAWLLPSGGAFGEKPPDELSVAAPTDAFAALLQLLEADTVDWDAVLLHIASHPREASTARTPPGQTPLCAAIDRDAPACVVAAILDAHPKAAHEVHRHSFLTPLYLAVARGAHPDVVSLILNANPSAAAQPVFNGCLPLHASSDVDTARMLIDAYPRGVGWKNDQGYLPLHRVSYAADSTADVVELLIEEGEKKRVGGECGGGGVFKETAQGITPLAAVCCTITGGLQVDEFRSISETSLLSRSAQVKWGKLTAIVRAASEAEKTRRLKLQQHWRKGCFPGGGVRDEVICQGKFRLLHSVIDLGCPPLVVSHALRTNREQSEEFDETGRSALSLAAGGIDTPENVIEMLLDPNQCGSPVAAGVMDRSGRLPLHWAIAAGRGYDNAMKAIIGAAPRALETRDGWSGLYPFMMAALHCSRDINASYKLLRESPWLIRSALGSNSKCRQPAPRRWAIENLIAMQSCMLLPVIAILLHFALKVFMEPREPSV